jgi:hypothetical protein
MLVAIAMVLADIAGDTRRATDRAEASLKAMTPQHIMEAGLSGDYAEVGIRLLRTFDVRGAERDPATSGSCLSQYYDTVKRLFIDGYIMYPVNRTGGIPELGDHCPSKTLTQIAQEQFADCVQIRYGDKVKVLWSKTAQEECAESLAQMQSIARDQLDRLRAGFLESEVYMCMRAFDVLSWQRGGDEDAARARRLLQLRKARALCKSYSVPYSQNDWERVVEAACEKREELSRRGDPSRSAGGTRVDNRKVWSALLPAGSSAEESVMRSTGLEPVVRSYLSLVDSTGDVERGLGVHSNFVQHHLGAHEGGCCLSEICFLLKTYGPQEESVLFQQGPQGELLLTAFSRACCRLWRALHGRRFACYRSRANAGAKKTGWRLRGSAKAVKLLQHDAFDALEEEAIKDEAQPQRGPPNARATFAGLSRHLLLKRAVRIALPLASKKLTRFRQDTKKLIGEKTARGRWTGFGKTLPPLRRRPGNSQTSLIVGEGLPAPQPTRQVLVHQLRERASRWQGKKPVIIDLLEDQDQPEVPLLDIAAKRPLKYRKMSDEYVERATCVKVQSGDDLLRGEADSNKLRAWLSVIALGKKVRPKDSQEIEYKSALKESHKLCFSDKFVRRYPNVIRSYQRYASHKKSAWKEASTAPATTKALDVVRVDTLDDFRQWLISARRFSSWAGVGVDGVTVHRGGISRYGRETVSAA